jgi:hypothetical protein
LIGLIFYILIPYLSIFDNSLLLLILLSLTSLINNVSINNTTISNSIIKSSFNQIYGYLVGLGIFIHSSLPTFKYPEALYPGLDTAIGLGILVGVGLGVYGGYLGLKWLLGNINKPKSKPKNKDLIIPFTPLFIISSDLFYVTVIDRSDPSGYGLKMLFMHHPGVYVKQVMYENIWFTAIVSKTGMPLDFAELFYSELDNPIFYRPYNVNTFSPFPVVSVQVFSPDKAVWLNLISTHNLRIHSDLTPNIPILPSDAGLASIEVIGLLRDVSSPYIWAM